MAGEIRQYDVNGSTWYAVIVRASDGYWLNSSTFEDPVAANWSSYARSLTQKSTTGAYYADFPAIAAGLYDVVIYRQAGGSPETSDGPPMAVMNIDWGGSAETTVTSRLATSGYTVPPSAAAISTQVASDLAMAHGAGSWATATGFSTLTAGDIPTTAQIADKILGRNIGGGSDGGRTVTQAMRALRNRFTRTTDTYTVYAEDDSTVSWTSTLTTNDALDPVSESNP